MRKLGLIIPIQKSQKKHLHVPFLLMMAFIPFRSHADRYGCYVNEYSFYIFHNEYAELGGYPNYLFSSNENNYPDTYYQRDGRCPESTTTACYLYNFNGTLKAIGYVADFSYVSCPMDNYIPAFFIFTLSITLLRFREKKNT